MKIKEIVDKWEEETLGDKRALGEDSMIIDRRNISRLIEMLEENYGKS